jgi:nuclease S1
MRKLLATTLIGAASLACVSTHALAWGGHGHRIVAAIAFKLLPPEKAAALDKLLQQSDVKRNFVEAASYADEVIRGEDHAGKFSPWHFVDWPDKRKKYNDSFCEPTCIIDELPDQIDAASTQTDQDDKALALSWVIHLVGDIHQPLHVSDRKDRGGNDFHVTYRGSSECSDKHGEKVKKVELHKVWDDCLVFELQGDDTWQQLAEKIRGNLTTYKGHPAASGEVQDWANESHALAHKVAYDGLKQGADLQDSYIKKALPLVRDQLLKAGIRLAKTVDENLQ